MGSMSPALPVPRLCSLHVSGKKLGLGIKPKAFTRWASSPALKHLFSSEGLTIAFYLSLPTQLTAQCVSNIAKMLGGKLMHTGIQTVSTEVHCCDYPEDTMWDTEARTESGRGEANPMSRLLLCPVSCVPATQLPPASSHLFVWLLG